MVEIKTNVPLLPLRGLLVYPEMLLHIDVGRERSIYALEEAMAMDGYIFLTTQKDTRDEDPTEEELYTVGTYAKVKQLKELKNGTYRVMIEGVCRATYTEYEMVDLYPTVTLTLQRDEVEMTPQLEAEVRVLNQYFESYGKVSQRISKETIESVASIKEPGRLADMIATHLPLKLAAKQKVLEMFSISDRVKWMTNRLASEQEVIRLERRISKRVKEEVEATQKEYYLREQLKAIQKELGDKDGKSAEIVELEKRIEEAKMPEHVSEAAYRELRRYEHIPQASAESGVIRNYLEWLVTLPWSVATEDTLDLTRSEEILNRDHDGLEKVKERILEYLAVRQMTDSIRGPIICLAGPPGVGKTSLARSIAESLNRNFVRISLGGVRDESEIRGHRRTYVGAMPGRIIQGMKKAGTTNPVFLLDEIDKMSNDFRGDPSSAMLEVLDPEQNANFSDHYIEETYDLSNVFFLATANDISTIPGPLRDRMEIIQLAGYTEMEKKAIALNHLIPKQLKEHGLTKSQVKFREDAVEDIIRYYTREAGVRNLEREIANVCRKAVKQLVSGERKSMTITTNTLSNYLGKRKFRHGLMEEQSEVGVATGLAYTQVGGDTLQIEVALSEGKGKLVLTGKLGEVMQESAQTALSYVRSNAKSLNIDPKFYEKTDIHIHVPEGAVPKDGPSAGITIVTALVSALTNRPIRRDVGMTGEVTLRGKVLPIGGLKEKSLSAHRAGIRTIILPYDNERDLEDIPESIREELEFHLVKDVKEVLSLALEA
ncbi:endopeptidase La [Savagea faecisuis]|uniref:Lon protease n=1 Tax=Savagea faecisuis TaxID=1274803 RepID=A0ABW3GTX6_9BACL